MPNYKESNVTGTKWQRSYAASISNKVGELPKITFFEEEVVVVGDNTITRHLGQIDETFIRPQTEFELLNPTDDSPTGQFATYEQLYVLLYSLYNSLAKDRDARIQE